VFFELFFGISKGVFATALNKTTQRHRAATPPPLALVRLLLPRLPAPPRDAPPAPVILLPDAATPRRFPRGAVGECRSAGASAGPGLERARVGASRVPPGAGQCLKSMVVAAELRYKSQSSS